MNRPRLRSLLSLCSSWALPLAGALVLGAGVTLAAASPALGAQVAAQAPSVTSSCPQSPILAITTTGLPPGAVGTAYDTGIQVNGIFPPYSFSLISGTLPPGLSLSGTFAASGTISGTPTTPGTYDFTIQVTDTLMNAASQPLSITIGQPAPLAVFSASLPAGNAGAGYSQTLGASGGTAPYTWSVVAGLLPPGLSVCATNGTIWGTPSIPGNYQFTAQVTDATGATASRLVSVTISQAGGFLTVSTTSLPPGAVGTAYDTGIQVNGIFPPYDFSLISGTLPPGLSLSGTFAASGTISGTPTTPGTYDFTIQVTDTLMNPFDQSLSITIGQPAAPLTVSTASLPAGTVGTGYSQPLKASGGTPPYSWTVQGGSLPAGLSLSNGGLISGTPATAGNYSFTVKATDANAATATQALSIQVNPASTGTTCTVTITGTHPTQLTVSSGVTCLTNAVQNGSVTVAAGAGLVVTDSTVQGTVTATGAAEVSYCGSTQQGTMTITGTTGPVTLGDGGSCAADTIPSLITISGTAGAVTVNGLKENGTITLSANTGGVDLSRISLSGLAHVQDNAGTAPITVSGNAINGSLYCTGNTPAPGDGGTVNTVAGVATGQCAGLAKR